MKKSFICTLIFLLLALCCTLLFASCKQSSPCANGHTAVTDAAVAATCTQKGLTEGSHCSACHAVIVAQEHIPALAHTPGEWQVTLAATCTQKGSQYRACTVCETILELGELPTSAHAYGTATVVSAPTCSGAGTKQSVCAICKDVKAEAIPATNHTPGGWITDVAASCTNKGMRHKICTICEETLVLETLPLLDHTPGALTVITAPTCTENGKQTSTCTACGTVETTVLPAPGHTLGTPVVVLAASCTADGVQHRFCTVCESTTPVAVEAIPASGHQHSGWQLLSAASCFAPGVQVSTCGKCNDMLRQTIAATAHADATWTTLLAATADTAGLETGACPSCLQDLGMRYINPLNASAGLAYTIVNNEECRITGLGTCTDAKLVIPCYISGYPVTSITSLGSGTAVTEISIPPTVKLVTSSVASQSALVRTENGVRYVGNWAVGYIAAELPEDVTLRSGTVGIADNAFSSCNKLKAVTFPTTVKYIGTAAFYNTALTAMHLPSTVQLVGTRAFSSCSQLTSITVEAGNPFYSAKGNCLIETASKTLLAGCKASTIPADGSVTAIAAYAFYGQSGLKQINIPNGVNTIGTYAFFRSGISGLSIPESVVTIAAYALGALSDLTTLTVSQSNPTFVSVNGCLIQRTSKLLLTATKTAMIPADGSVTNIGPYAFAYRALQSISLPTQVTGLQEYAFAYSTLPEISMPGIVNIGQSAFYGCEALHSVTLSSVLTTINTAAFQNCTALRAITLPASLTSIGSYAFQNTRLYSITIPSGVTTVNTSAFLNCYKLLQIRNLSSVTMTSGTHYTALTYQEIKQDSTAFSYTISAPDANGRVSLTAGGYVWLFDYLGSNTTLDLTGTSFSRVFHYALYQNNTVKQVVLPSTVTTVYNYAFYGCKALESLSFSGTVIYDYAFRSCSALKNVTLPNVVTVRSAAFRDCTALTSVALPKATLIQAYAFQNCSMLASVSLPKVTQLNGFAFQNCTALTSVALPKVTAIYASAFQNCTALETLSIGTTLSTINSNVFLGCTALKTVTAPASVLEQLPTNALETLVVNAGTEIPACTLSNCLTLKSLTLPSSLYVLREGAFAGCVNLKTATLPTTAIANFPKDYLESVTIIAGTTLKDGSAVAHTTVPATAFLDDDVLKHVVIGSAIRAIGGQAFYKCDNLATCEFEGTYYPGITIGANTFCNAIKLWKLELPEGLVRISEQLLYGCTSLRSVTIPSTVTTIAHEAFYQCGLESITIPKGVTMMEHRIPDNTTRGAFGGCLNLKSVVFESGSQLKQLPNFCFQGCTALTSISSIPSTVTCIGKNAFQNCTKLTSVGFENPTGWKCYAVSTCTAQADGFTSTSSGTAVTLSTGSANATLLKSTRLNYYWKRT